MNEINIYKAYASKPKINIPVITKLRLNTCEPYIIKYPIPYFETKNSPIITPIKDI